ncbi:hypothetical protein Plec18170_004393 [Paecilomyces lecythidis]
MSFVRLLLHSNEYQIEGLAAVTSYWQNSSTYPDQIEAVVKAYGKVLPNLQSHAHGKFPSEEYLLSKIRSGSTKYGLAAIDALEAGNKTSPGADLLVSAVDSSEAPLYVQLWGGANVLAEALWKANKTKTADEFSQFLSKLRVYAISDQDNSGAWIRFNFPSLRYIASIHGWNQYGLATWSGISGDTYYDFDHGGPDSSLVTNAWIHKNIQLGPLGGMYPSVQFIMEGDSPSLMFTMQNGLNSPEHPEWGSWGGRYTAVSLGGNQFADATDHVVGQNGQMFISNHATIWRWRSAYQNEMAARVQWTLQENRKDSNTTHPPVVVVNGSCGSEPLEVHVKTGAMVTLDASGSYDPDGRSLNLTWWHYREPTMTQWSISEVPRLNFTSVPHTDNRLTTVKIPEQSMACKSPQAASGAVTSEPYCQQYHVILQATNGGTHPITRYRRVILKTQPANGTIS